MHSSVALTLTLLHFFSLCRAETVEQIAAGYGLTVPEYELHHRVILVHGIIMGIAFAIMYPLGAVFIRALKFKGLLWFHAGWQVAAYVLTLTGLGMGIWLVVVQGDLLSTTGHPIIGLIVIGTILLLPPLGWIHHVVFVRKQSRSVWTYMHRWIGRVILVLGGINGGLGLWMEHDTPTWLIIAYTACSSAFFTLWLATITIFAPAAQVGKPNDGKNGGMDATPRRSSGSEQTLAVSGVEQKEQEKELSGY